MAHSNPGLRAFVRKNYAVLLTTTVAVGASGLAISAASEGVLQIVAAALGVGFLSAAAAMIGRRIGSHEKSAPVVVAAPDRTAMRAIEAATSRSLRRFSEPWLRPYPPSDASSKRVVLLPGASYHLAEIEPLADQLESRGYEPLICVGEPHWARTQPGLFWLDRPVYGLPQLEDLGDLHAVVTMKDWGGYQPLVVRAKELSVPTFAIVEGAQDFADLHQPVEHRPYQTADTILCQGDNDARALSAQHTVVVGSNRIEQLLHAPVIQPTSNVVVINVNFSYGVLTEHRDMWVASTIEGCTQAGLPWILALHPAISAPSSWTNTTRLPVSSLLPEAAVLVSRFSTVPYEAMARGIEFVYHNPHHEMMPAFRSPLGAFQSTRSSEELARALGQRRDRLTVRAESMRFISHQVDVIPGQSPSSRMADAIVERC